jgi:type IV fimbrial biogenesis protein FimT
MNRFLHVTASSVCHGGRRAAARQAGVTLVELLLTLAIAGIVAALGAPSFVHMLARHAMGAQAEQLQDALRLGRNEAMTRGGPVVLCRTDAPATSRCAGTGGSWQTWLLFADVDRNGAFDPGDALLRQRLEGSHRTSVDSRAASLRFESTGIARSDDGAAVSFVFETSAAASGATGGDRASQRQLCVNPRGEVALVAGGAPCP